MIGALTPPPSSRWLNLPAAELPLSRGHRPAFATTRPYAHAHVHVQAVVVDHERERGRGVRAQERSRA